MRSVVEIGASVPAFLGKLWKLVNDSETNHLISWSPGGKTFVIKNQAEFARELLPLYYKHNNMASFIRQLNMYGFHKITSVENGGLRYEKDEIEFSHPCFMKGHAYLLEHIKRKIANPKALVVANDSDKMIVKPELMTKVLADVKQMKGKQESLDAKFSAMKQENEALWREVAILRQKHIKQQQIVNNLIQFLMSLVQQTPPPPRPTGGKKTAGVKRPYQLMINSAAHNSSDGSYSSTLKNMKIDKEVLDDLNEDNMEDGPTIHELAHDDALHNDASQDPLDPAEFVRVDFAQSPIISNPNNNAETLTSTQYHVTLEDGEDADTDRTRLAFPITQTNGFLRIPDNVPIVTSPSPTMASTSPIGQPTLEQVINNVVTPSASTSNPKIRSATKNMSTSHKSLLSPNSFNVINPSADFKLPADIFASDDSVSDTGVNVPEELTALQESILGGDQTLAITNDKVLEGLNIKLEKPGEFAKSSKKSKKSKDISNTSNLNLADIKTELQDDFDWSQMALATVNNNANRFQTVYRRDNNQNREEYSSHFGSHSNKNDIDDHLDTMQTDLESLRELLRSDTYAVDTNTILGLFGSEDPFYGLSYNPSDDRSKTCNNAEGSQLISYTGNIPDFEDISIPDLEGENSQEACLSPSPSPSSTTLNTPQVELRSPHYSVRP